ncbi:hypothetical protein LINGRAHAP2_LOCUS24354, partial [Linum grandiflorum]
GAAQSSYRDAGGRGYGAYWLNTTLRGRYARDDAVVSRTVGDVRWPHGRDGSSWRSGVLAFPRPVHGLVSYLQSSVDRLAWCCARGCG